MSLAGVEGLKMKRLVGSLRALWRSSRKNGSDCRITDLKRYLRPSPDPDRRGDEDVSPDSPLGDDNDDNTDNAAAPEAAGDSESYAPIRDDVGSEDGSVVGGEDEPPSPLESPAPSLPPLSPPKSLDESSDEGGMAPAQAAVVDGSDSEYSINAPTLQLGSSDSEDENQRCSQVSSGWLGNAYMAHNEIEREKKRQHDQEQYENYLDQMCEFIPSDLEKDLNTSLMDTEMWEGYKRKCYKALDQYGHHVYCDLSNLDNFNAWISQQKDPAAVNLDLWV